MTLILAVASVALVWICVALFRISDALERLAPRPAPPITGKTCVDPDCRIRPWFEHEHLPPEAKP